jgi:hypothetical protein
MFNWTTTTIVNSLKDYTTGDDLIKVFTKDFANASAANPVLKIKRDHTFESRYITKVYKAIASNPTLCQMTIDCDKIAAAITEYPAHVRLSFYIALEGSNESIYANDGYQKGKPFSVGFDVKKGDTGETIAKKIVANASKYGIVMYGKKIFDLTAAGAVLTLKGTHEYQRFKNAVVAVDDVIDEDFIDTFENGQTTSEGGVFTLVTRGTNGLGTYHQLLKDLRLPTAHNTKWLALKEDEKLSVGAKYNQYIINYCAPSMANPGFTVVGQHNSSATTHIFWVNQAVDTEFLAYLTAAGITPEVVNSVDDSTGEDVVTLNTKTAAEAGTKYSTNHTAPEDALSND